MLPLLEVADRWQALHTAPPSHCVEHVTVWVVCALSMTVIDAYQLAFEALDRGHLIILAGASIEDDIQARLSEPLILHPMSPGITVGWAIAAPLDSHDWPQ